MFGRRNREEAIPRVWQEWPANIYALPGPFTDYTMELDCLSELDNESIQLKVDLRAESFVSGSDGNKNMALIKTGS